MKKINLVAVLWFVQLSVQAQPDSNLFNTSTATKASAWLQNLKLTPAVSQISCMINALGIEQLSSNSRHYVDSLSMTAYYANAPMVNNDLRFAGQNMRFMFRNVQRAGIGLVRCPHMFPLATIEPSQGVFNYSFSDSTVKIAGLYSLNIVGSILPYADWVDSCHSYNVSCSNLFAGQGDWFFLNNNRTGDVCVNDTSVYYTFVQKLVQRYGPGGNMPGLTNPISIWECSNEPDGEQCSGYDSATYLRDLGITYRALKAVCPSCEMMNGGSIGLLNIKDTNFWRYVIQNGYRKMSIANFHDNDGKNIYPFDFGMYLDNVDNFQHPMNSVGSKYPIWVTEWGLYSGSPNSLPNRTEDEQAAMYTKIFVYGLAHNVLNQFFDLSGPSNNSIGSASLIQETMTLPVDTFKARLFFYTQKLLQYKFRTYDSAKVVMFDSSTSLSKGEVHLYVGGKLYYVLWGLSTLPVGLSGTKIVTDIYGNADTVNVSTLSLPLASDPIIIEDYSLTALPEIHRYASILNIYPNPFTQTTNIVFSTPGRHYIDVTDVTGRKIRIMECSGTHYEMSRGGLSSGVYFVKSHDEGQTYVTTMKIVIE